jgi:DNA primase
MGGRIPQRFIDDVLARTDIVALIDSYVPLKLRGKEYIACCPFHQEKTPSFTVSPDKQFYHCFGCGAHGTALGFLLQYERLDFPAAVERLAHRLGLEVPQEDGAPSQNDELAPLYAALEDAQAFYQQCLRKSPRAIAYLKGRGVSGKTARDFALGYAPDDWVALCTHLEGRFSSQVLRRAGLAAARSSGGDYDRFRDRIVFPIRNRTGRTIGFGARSLGDGQPKYLNSPETPVFSKGRSLYGWHEARKGIAAARRVIVVEGYMDAVALVQAGFGNVVATLGTATTADHIRQIYGSAPDILFCFDGDRAGLEAGWRAAQQLLPHMEDGRDAKFIFLPRGEDPDSLVRKYGPDAFEEALENASPFAEYFFNRLSSDLDVAAMAGKARLAERAKPLIGRLPPGVFAALLRKRLSEAVGVDVDKAAFPLDHRRPRSAARATAPQYRSLDVAVTAAGLLLHRPDLVPLVPHLDSLKCLTQNGIGLLIAMTELILSKPDLSAAARVERFRDTAYAADAARLLTVDLPPDPEREFEGAMARLDEKLKAQRFEILAQKAKLNSLTAEEKAEYGRLAKLARTVA